MSAPRGRIAVGVRAGLLFAVLGVVAWLTGRAFIFPSLGPSAFILALDGRSERTRPRTVILGHAIGAVAGLAAYVLIAGDATMRLPLAAGSMGALRLAASGTLSVALTGWGMLARGAVHPPACATTLIVSLGLLSTPTSVVIIVLAVVLMVAVHEMTIGRQPSSGEPDSARDPAA